VALEQPRWRELAELVADHVFGQVDGNELLPVVDRNGVPDHFGYDGRPARPRLDDALLALTIHRLDFLEEMQIDERTFLE
jgi:hypothetical protein